MDNAGDAHAALKQTLAGLRESEELHRLTLSAITDAIFLTDNTGVLHFVCPNLTHIFGLSQEELQVGENISSVLGDFEVDVAALNSTGSIDNISHTIVNRDGETRRLMVLVRRVSIGGATRLYACRDVTQLHLQTAEQQRLLHIIESAGDFIGIVDAQRRPIYINLAGLQMVGLADDTDVTAYEVGYFHPEWARKVVMEEGIPHAIEHGIWTGQSALLTVDGVEIPVSQQIVAHRDAHGELTNLSTLCRDIRPLHVMYEGQRRRTQQQAAVAEIGLHAVQGNPLAELLTEAVQAGARLLGADVCVVFRAGADSEMEVIACDGADRELQAAICGSLSDQAAPLSASGLQVLLRNAGMRSALMVPVSGKDSAFGALGVHARREAAFNTEDADFLQALANTLSAAVVRTEDQRLSAERRNLEQQLIQAQKLEALGTLAGGIAHDFNNILYAITGYSELVIDGLPPDSELRGFQSEVLNAAQRAAELVKQILSISRHAPEEVRPVQVSLVAKEVGRLLRAALPSDIELQVEIEATDALVLSNPAHLHQVMLNLCTNAGQAMRIGGGRLILSLREVQVDAETAQRSIRLVPGDYVLITVSDTGKGVAPEIRDRIFEPFFTTKDVGEGTGLGLSIVNGIVTRYGGAIRLYSEIGLGTAFYVYLPRHHGSEDQPVAQASNEELRGNGERVLFVDDEPALAALGESLSLWGYAITAVTDPREALRLMEANPAGFDVLVTDQTMPGLSGFDLAQACRQLHPGMPVILCTGFSHTIDADQAKAAGIGHFMVKPLTRVQLGRALREALAETGEQ